MKYSAEGSGSLKKILIYSVIFCLIVSSMTPIKVAKADATTQVSATVDYTEEIIRVTAGTGHTSTRFYMSTDNQKTWDLLDVSGVVDISGFLASKVVTLYFKGNKDLSPAKVELPAEDSSLKAAYTIVGGDGRITLTNATSPVEYRKGANGPWRPMTGTVMYTAIYEVKGATLYFRTVATAGKRAGKIVTVKISKRPTAPTVKLDYSKLCISGLKAGETQYRVGDSSVWVPFTSTDPKVKSISLYTLLAVSPSAIIPAGTIEFRTQGKDKKLHSSVKIIEVPAQITAPTNVALTGTTLTITDTNTKRYYEYTIVHANAILDYNTAKWTAVTSRNAVVIPKAIITDKIYVRLKSATDTNKFTNLPSVCTVFTVTAITQK
jgi:hypothetical protein